ncbi:hypothetical protein MPTK1_1g13730 [Marchantia polymorpha subsp. ruderalis]|uniref:Uncharacterized protein n=2 Tax=Marchantia polymorpha TaxID=3197 RepID=A0AAF6APU0_MARPO|nr:hypothetical protein MARPO_0019s0143 [Marchantia polymorpha]BBM98460.1 hypothetical protein Mp_1g13730 [Marchantia polymorpha subsp. ruderalis]|eukprot:PTQ44731.1 hypothetical protein MARPO_0019s0143 [Marchantia polymorpha]
MGDTSFSLFLASSKQLDTLGVKLSEYNGAELIKKRASSQMFAFGSCPPIFQVIPSRAGVFSVGRRLTKSPISSSSSLVISSI